MRADDPNRKKPLKCGLIDCNKLKLIKMLNKEKIQK